MNLRLKAVLLSAFVLPGLGQLATDKKVKGTVIILLVNVFILAALAFVGNALGHILVVAKYRKLDITQAINDIQHYAPAVRWLLATLAAIWCYSVADVILSRGTLHNDSGNHDQPGKRDLI